MPAGAMYGGLDVAEAIRTGMLDALTDSDHTRLGEFLTDAPIAIAAAMTPEDELDPLADGAILARGGGGRGGG